VVQDAKWSALQMTIEMNEKGELLLILKNVQYV